MGRTIIKCEPFPEGEAARLRAQWPDEDDNLFQTTSFSSLTLRVYDLSVSNTTTPVFSNARTVATVLTNVAQSWALDGTGYNFADNVLTNEVAYEGGHTYRWSYEGVRTDGTGSERLAFEARADPSYYL